jgi:hypothetical protein
MEQTRHHKRTALMAVRRRPVLPRQGEGGDAHQQDEGHRVTPREALGKTLFDWFAFTVTEERSKALRAHTRSGRECTVRLRSGWRPFTDNAPAELNSDAQYLRQYDAYHNTNAAA